MDDWLDDLMRRSVEGWKELESVGKGIGHLTAALGECDSDCATQRGGACTCGARKFREKFGPGKGK